MAELSGIEALTFDIGGTVFDWRGTIEEEVNRLARGQGRGCGCSTVRDRLAQGHVRDAGACQDGASFPG